MTLNISYPKPQCLCARYLARFLQGETLKHREADSATGSYRLASHVHYLQEKHGWHIERREVTEATRDPTGRAATFMEYWLATSLIEWAGSQGQEYVEKVLELEAIRIADRLAATSPTADDNPMETDKPKPNMESVLCNDHNHGQE
ncbi:MAG: hypothetical protein D9N14_04865 [Ketobacter sp.]|nr:MAG: hypothetical protein D9N14_04865 [Ketobacter sp.]